MKSIKTRVVGYFMLIIVITVVILEVLLIYTIKENYYRNLENNVSNQLILSAELYERYFSDSTLEENILNNVDTFWKQTDAQVQIVNRNGRVIMDSIGVQHSEEIKENDVMKALGGERGSWIGSVAYDSERVMAVSYPLKSRGEIIGALRFITSLREANRNIRQISLAFILIGFLVVLISGALSIFLSNSIVLPLRDVTRLAARMAEGNYDIKIQNKRDDEIGRLSETLNYMSREITKREELKNDFISSVSHELRTPLTSIKGWAITLQNKEFQAGDTLQDGLEIIEKESERLSGMVEELLDFSKFVSGKITIKKERIDVKSVIRHINKQLLPRARREKIDFIVSFEDDLPIIIGDGNRLKQLFINILDNAFNFTDSGGRVELTAKRDGENIVFKIEDTGCGIPEDELPRVTEKFYKGKSSKSKNGIGLSICSEIVKLMEGKLEIKSRVKEGTSVYITLPIGKEDKLEKN